MRHHDQVNRIVWRARLYRGSRGKLKCGNGWSRCAQIRGNCRVSQGFSTARGRELEVQSTPSCLFTSVSMPRGGSWPTNQAPRKQLARKHTCYHGQAWLVTKVSMQERSFIAQFAMSALPNARLRQRNGKMEKPGGVQQLTPTRCVEHWFGRPASSRKPHCRAGGGLLCCVSSHAGRAHRHNAPWRIPGKKCA